MYFICVKLDYVRRKSQSTHLIPPHNYDEKLNINHLKYRIIQNECVVFFSSQFKYYA